MKKLLFIIALTVWNTGIYAQKVFDETVFNGMMSRMQTDVDFFKNEADPSFMITYGNGGSSNQESILKTVKNMIGLYKRKETNLKVSQVGGTAVVTGKVEEQFFTKDKPNISPRIYNGVFTYTFSKVKGKWLMVSAQHTDVPTPFTKETLNEILAEYKTDSKEFMNSHLSEDWRYINSKGGYQARKDFIGGTKQNIVTTEMLNPVIFQSGNLAVTSGIHQTTRTTSDGKQVTGQVGATYTWQNRNGKWMFVGSQQNIKVDDNDEQAIKNVLMKETASIKARKVADIMSCYANKPDLMFGPYKNTLIQGYDALKIEVESLFKNLLTPSPDTYDFNNWNIKINGNAAFSTCTQTTNRPSGNNSEFFKSDYLEKNNGEWKIVDHRYFNKPSSQDVEESAIKNTIEGETSAFKQREAEKAIGFWLNTPYTSHHYTAKGLGYVRGANVGTTITNYLKANSKIDNSPTNYHDYIIRINGNSAWATYVSDGTSNGKKVVYNKAAYLEKTNGEWKMGSVNSVEAK